MPRLVIAGSNAGAVQTLRDVVDVLPPEDLLCIAPVGGATHGWHPSLLSEAQQHGVECLEPDDVNADVILARLADFAPGLFLSIYYNQLFRAPLLEVLACPVLNFHPSLLPRHRGVAPLIWAIAEGDEVTGVTVHHVDEGVDTGRIVRQLPIPIHPDDTGFSLHDKVNRLVRATAADLLRGWLAGEPVGEGWEQRGGVSLHTSRDPRLNHLDWTRSGKVIRDTVRALAHPLPGAYCVTASGTRIQIDEVESRAAPTVGRGRATLPGLVSITPSEVTVNVADGAVAITAARVGQVGEPEATVMDAQALADSGLLQSGEVLA